MFLHHIKRTLLLSLPLVGSQLAQILINTTDIVMLGWDGTYSLASGVLGTQAIFIFFIMGAGLAHAVVPLAAEADAKDDVRALRRVVRMGLWLTTLQVLLSMPILWNFEAIYLYLGQEPETSALAADYVQIAQWGLFFGLWGLVMRNFFVSIERPQIVFWAIIPGILLNVILNYVLIFGNFGAPALGVEGAAWASVATNLLILVVVLGWMFSKQDFRKYELLTRIWRSDWPIFFKVGKLGVPISVFILAEVSMFVGSSAIMGLIDVTVLAAHGIAMQLAGIAFMVPLGISNAATVRIGNAYGRKNVSDIHLAAMAALTVSVIYAAISASTFALFPEFFVNLFLDHNKPDALDVAIVAVPLVLVAAAFQLVDGVQAIFAGILRGFQDATIPMVVSIICYWPIGLLGAYILGITMGYEGQGVWWGLTIGLTVATISLSLRYRLVFKRFSKSLTEGSN